MLAKIKAKASALCTKKNADYAATIFRKNLPIFVMLFMMLASHADASNAATGFGDSLKSGFCSIYGLVKIVAGAIGLIMVVVYGVKFMGGDKDAIKMIIGVVVAVMICYKAPDVLAMFMGSDGKYCPTT